MTCTAVYSYLEVPNLKLRLGGHAIANNDPFSNGAWIVLAGAHFIRPIAGTSGRTPTSPVTTGSR